MSAADRYRVAFEGSRHAVVEVHVPDGAEPLDHIAGVIARELDLMRYEIQVGEHGGAIRMLGDTGPGVPFTLTRLDDGRPL